MTVVCVINLMKATTSPSPMLLFLTSTEKMAVLSKKVLGQALVSNRECAGSFFKKAGEISETRIKD